MKLLARTLFFLIILGIAYSKEADLVSFKIPISSIVKEAYLDQATKNTCTFKTVFQHHGIEFAEGCLVAIDEDRNMITGVLTKASADLLRAYLETLNGMTAEEIASGFELAEREARIEPCEFAPRPNAAQ